MFDPMPFFFAWCPTALEWEAAIAAHKAELLNTKPQMTALLEKIQEDVDKQFDENQSKWIKLRPTTIQIKEDMKADMRILHRTKSGQGLRLRDAYRQAGSVDEAGVLTYTYPEEKPYAKEHQTGVDRPERKEKEKPKRKTRLDRNIARGLSQMDKDYEDKFFD